MDEYELPEEVETDDVLDIDPDQEVLTSSYEITSYGADYPVDGLVKRLRQGDIVVPAFDPKFDESDEVEGFQRKFVWSRPRWTSLLSHFYWVCQCRASFSCVTRRTSSWFWMANNDFARSRPFTRAFTTGASTN